MISHIWKKLFFSPYYFTIALRKKNTEFDFEHPSFHADYIFPSTKNKWAADPILAEYQNHTFLFYEAVVAERGRIEVCEIFQDGSISPPVVLLDDEYHYSYPYIFQHDNQWYMIPETSDREEVRLYKATNFPFEWKMDQILMQQKCVDTTVFEADGNWFLLTFRLHPGSEHVTPMAYIMTFKNDHIDLSPINWDGYNELTCRGAGPVIKSGHMLYRPAQTNEAFIYGNSISFNRIHSLEPYSEQFISQLTPSSIVAKGIWFDGAHTYTESSRFEAIDIRCREFDFWKTPRTLFRKAMRIVRSTNP